MKKAFDLFIAIVVLGVLGFVMWKFKWWIIGTSLVFAVVLMVTNAIFRKIKGRNLKLYNHIMKEGEK